jgi:hypothetical protein
LRSAQTPPIIIRAGKIRDKDIEDLRAQTGKLVEDVNEIVDLVRSDPGVQVDRKLFVPVIVIFSLDQA